MKSSVASGSGEANVDGQDESVKQLKTHPVRRIASWVFWLLVAALVALAVSLVGVPLVADGKALVVKSGSMTPTLPIGSAVVIQQENVQEISPGEIITFADVDNGGRLVTHRVVSVEESSDGLRFTTKGDANEDPDSSFVKAEQVQGVYWYKIPFVGTAANFLTSTAGMLYGAAVLLLLFTAHLLLPKTVRRKQ